MRFYLLLSVFVSGISFAQKATVTGTLTDKNFNDESLAYAGVAIKGTAIGTNTDEYGKYSLSVNPGSHTLVFSFVGYDTKEIPFTIKEGETLTINHSMVSDENHSVIEQVEVVAVRKRSTESAVLLEVKEAKQVVSAISAEQISKGTDSNAAQAVQRVPGVTIVDGRFVMIRGLNERYNNVLINNSVAPSTEVDKRTFSFDLIPTSALDRMVIYKTGSADKPGDFAGGVIKITTSENFSDFNNISLGVGYRANTTFDTYMQSEGSNTDLLGFDNGYRNLPSNFPALGAININDQLSERAAHSLPNNFNPTQRSAFLDTSVGFSFGRNIDLSNGHRLMTVNSINHSNGYQYYQRQFDVYFALTQNGDPQPWQKYLDETYSNDTRITVLSNWIYRFNDNHSLKLKNLFNQVGENETIIRNGYNYFQRQNDVMKNYMLGYRSRSIYTGQLEGTHTLSEINKVDWVIGFNSVNENEPDLRRFRTFLSNENPELGYQMIDPPSSNLFDTSRFYGELKEKSISNGLNYTYSIKRINEADEELADFKLKTGYYFDYKNRDFGSRYFSYVIPGYLVPSNEDKNVLVSRPLDQIFSNEYVNATNGWLLREGTNQQDSYSSTNMLIAGYVYGEFPVGKFDISGGVRVENNTLTLDAASNAGKIEVDYPLTSVLPSLNVGYNLTEKSVLRTAYSRTVNRPEFREISPYLYYDFKNNANILGNENLQTATIDNLDLRYEFYPRNGETLSFGGFYKNFDKPIELATRVVSENQQFRNINSDKAYVYGVELEFRKSFDETFDNVILKRLSVNLNAAYIASEVDMGSNVVSGGGELIQDRYRPLQGQSPYIVNVALGYEDENDFQANIIFNRFGDRLFSVGDVNFPAIYELARNQVDLTLSKKVNSLTYKLGVSDLLNAKYRWYEDTNRNDKVDTSNDKLRSAFRRGTLFDFSVTYNF